MTLSTWTVSPSAVFCQLEDSAAVLETKHNTYYLLEGAAVSLWPVLEGGASMQQLLDTVTDTFEVDRTQAAHDLELWITGMQNAGLILSTEA